MWLMNDVGNYINIIRYLVNRVLYVKIFLEFVFYGKSCNVFESLYS